MSYPSPATVPQFAVAPSAAPNPSPQLSGYAQAVRNAEVAPISTVADPSLHPDFYEGATLIEAPLDPKVGDTVRILGSVGKPQKRRATSHRIATKPEPALPAVETSTSAHKKPRTGAGARWNPDSYTLYRAVNLGVAITALAAVLISWQGLNAVGAWLLLPPQWTWLLPVAIDVAIIVFTLGILPRKARGESTWLLAIGAYGLTSISAAANAVHVLLDSPDGTPDLQLYAGAGLAALSPLLILLTTEVLGTLITKPPRAETSSKKLADAQRELAEAKKAIKKLDKLVPKENA